MTNETEIPSPQPDESESKIDENVTPTAQLDEKESKSEDPVLSTPELDESESKIDKNVTPTAQLDETESKSEDPVLSTPELDESESEPEETVTFKRSSLYTVLIIMYAVLVPLALVAGLGAGYLLWGQETSSSGANAAEPQPLAAQQAGSQDENVAPQPSAAQQSSAQDESVAPEAPREITRYDVSIDDDPFYGPAGAPITIIEFSDYECPFCRKWHLEVLPRLIEEYPDQFRLVFRDFPLTSIHSNAVPAAMAANCANEQNAYWEYNERLFSMDLGLGTDAYQGYAAELGLDTDAFDECLESNRYEEEVMADFQYASTLGVRSTPTFFINGIAVVGAQPFEVFKQVFDQELAGELD